MGKRDQSAPTRKARAAASDKDEVIFHGDVKEQVEQAIQAITIKLGTEGLGHLLGTETPYGEDLMEVQDPGPRPRQPQKVKKARGGQPLGLSASEDEQQTEAIVSAQIAHARTQLELHTSGSLTLSSSARKRHRKKIRLLEAVQGSDGSDDEEDGAGAGGESPHPKVIKKKKKKTPKKTGAASPVDQKTPKKVDGVSPATRGGRVLNVAFEDAMGDEEFEAHLGEQAEYADRLAEWEIAREEFVDGQRVNVAIKSRRRDWTVKMTKAWYIVYNMLGSEPQRVVAPAAAEFDIVEAFRLLRCRYNKASTLGVMQRLLGFLNFGWDKKLKDHQNVDIFNRKVDEISEKPDRGGVGPTIQTKDLATALWLRNLGSVPRHAHLRKALLRDEVSSLADAQEKLMNEHAVDDRSSDTDEDLVDNRPSRGRRPRRPGRGDRLARGEQEELNAHDTDDKCANCGKTGHPKTKCYQRGGGWFERSHLYEKERKAESGKANFRKELRKEVLAVLRSERGIVDSDSESESEATATPTPKKNKVIRKRAKIRLQSLEVVEHGTDDPMDDEWEDVTELLAHGESMSPVVKGNAACNRKLKPRRLEKLPTQLESQPEHADDVVEATIDTGATNTAFTMTDIAKIGPTNVQAVQNTVAIDAHGNTSQVKQRVDLENISVDLATGKRADTALNGIIAVDHLRKNLVSVPKLVLAGHRVVFDAESEGGSYIQMKGREDRIPLVWKSKSWVLRIHLKSLRKSKMSRRKLNHLYHRRWCHIGRGTMDLIHRRRMVTGLDWKPLTKDEQCACSVCTTAMSTQAPAPKVHRTRSREPGAVAHVDFAVLPVASRNGNKLAAIFTDDNTRYRHAFYAPTAKSVHKILQLYINECKARGYELKIVRCDSEWITTKSKELARKHGFVFKSSAPMSQWQDGVSERHMRTWGDRVRCVLKDQQRGPEFWEYAGDMVIETTNCAPISAEALTTPWEPWWGSQPDTSHFRMPLCDVSYHVYKTEKKTKREREVLGRKLSDKRRRGILIGYAHDQLSYKILRVSSKKGVSGTIVFRRYDDCRFEEKSKLPRSERSRMRSTQALAEKLAKKLAKAVPGADDQLLLDEQVDDYDDGEASEEDDLHAENVDAERHIHAMTAGSALRKTQTGGAEAPLSPGESPTGGAAPVLAPGPPPKKVKKAKKAKTKEVEIRTKLRRVTMKEGKMTHKALAKSWQVPIEVLKRLNANHCVDTTGNSKFKATTDLWVPDQPLPAELLALDEAVSQVQQDRAAKVKLQEHIDGLATAACHYEYVAQGVPQTAHNDGYSDTRTDGYVSGNTEYLFNLQLGGIRQPRGYGDAHSDANPNSDDWRVSEDTEMKALATKWTEVPMSEPLDANMPIGRGMWQYAVKIDKLKARWCFDGSQQADVPDDIAAHVLRYATARLLLIKGVHYGNECRVSDVSNAFLHHPCKRFYMRHPPGRGTPGTCMAFDYCLYGRREAPMGWLIEVEAFLQERGFVPSRSDPSHWIKKGARPDLDVDVGVFVDDFLMQGPTDELDELERSLSAKWPVKHMKDVSKPENTYLGMNVSIDRDRRILEISQTQSIQKFVMQQGLENARSLSLPMQKASKLVRAEEKCTDKKLLHEFRSCVGSIMHYAVVSRPDIAFVAIKLARLQLYCNEEHLKVAHHVVRYLKGTQDLTLRYDCSVGDIYCTAVAASDSDWAEGEDCKSTSGNVYFLCGAALTWMCSTQRSVAHSSCEAEYVALDDMAREIVAIKQQMHDFRLDQKRTSPIIVLEDNQAAIFLSKSRKVHGRTKHIAVRYHYVRELIRDKELEVSYQPSEFNPADLFTKQLGIVLFVRHRETVMGHAPIQGVQQYYD